MSSNEGNSPYVNYTPDKPDAITIGEDEISKSLEESNFFEKSEISSSPVSDSFFNSSPNPNPRNLSSALAENEEEIYKGKTVNKYGSFTRRKINVLPGTQPKLPENNVNLNTVPNDFLEVILSDPKKTSIFKKYLAEKFVLEHFNFYVAYQSYKNEADVDVKQRIGDELYEQYINPNGKTPIGLSHVVVKKVKKLHDAGSEKGFSQVLQQVIYPFFNLKTLQTLTTAYVGYVKSSYENQNHNLLDDSKNEKKATASKNIEELIENEKEFKLFEDYCHENLAKNLYDCLSSIVKQKDLNEIFSQFLGKDATQLISHNDEVINPMIEKYHSKDDSWVDDAKKWLMKTLSVEVHPRFLNSKLWKDYISSQFSNDENSNFNEKYEIIKLDKDLSTISSSVQILTVRNQITNEIFKVKKIKTSTNLSKNESLLYLEKPRHSNLIHCSEILKEDNDVYKETTLYIIANDTPISVDKFINDLKESKEFLSQLDIYDLMFQMVSALELCHEKNFEFEIGTLNEFNMYLTSTLDSVLIDTGFFYDEEVEIPKYYNEDIYGDEKTEKSSLEDIFSLGMIFFRLLTLLPIEEIEELFVPELKPNKTQKKLSTKEPLVKKPSLLSAISQSFGKLTDAAEKPPKYMNNLRNYLFENKKTYDEDLLNLVMRMIDNSAYKRPSASQIITSLVMIKKKAIARPSFITKENSLKKITDGMTFEQKTVITDPDYRQYFKDFLRVEFCVESILFFEDVTKFKSLKGSERIEKANEIILSYLSTRKSDLQVNINAKLIKNVSSNLKLQLETMDGLDDDLFDDALGHVVFSVLSDNYPRFESHEMFNKMNTAMNGDKKGTNKKSTKIVKK